MEERPVRADPRVPVRRLPGRAHRGSRARLLRAGDDGSVWYFGEDVYNYADGVVRDTSGTWLAGKEGPAAMIMPGAPKVGDVNRPENIPGLVFEEVAVKAVDRTMAGPQGGRSRALWSAGSSTTTGRSRTRSSRSDTASSSRRTKAMSRRLPLPCPPPRSRDPRHPSSRGSYRARMPSSPRLEASAGRRPPPPSEG